MFGPLKRWFESSAAATPVTASEQNAGAAAGKDAYRAGLACFNAGDYGPAATLFEAAIAERHDDACAHCSLGLANFKLKKFEDAADSFHLAVHFRPQYAEPHYYLALLAQHEGNLKAAMDAAARACALQPGFADAHHLLGACAMAAGDIERAVASLTKAGELKPQTATFLSDLGYVLTRDCGKLAEGAGYLEKAVQLDPANPSILVNYCLVLWHQGRLDAIIAICTRLLDANPNDNEARLNRALALLKKGLFAEGWPDYEARRHTRSNFSQRPYQFAPWQGQPLRGKTLLVYGEQGLGEEIMFASCLPEVIETGARCIIECSPRLEMLFRRSLPAAVVHGAAQTSGDTRWLDQFGPVDFQIAAGDLPAMFRQRLADFPRHAGYLRPVPARTEYWSARLQALGTGPKIGIAWRGGTVSTRGALRSLDLCALTPLLQRKGLHFISLQYDATIAEVSNAARAQGFALCHWPDAIDDLDETAALMPSLDLVITVCNAGMHLAGASGRPTWAMVAAVPDWRYLEKGDSLPWYPSVRMFRQSAPGDWQNVIDQIEQALFKRYPV